jgi:LPXTG-motif cell wall-anchored protein
MMAAAPAAATEKPAAEIGELELPVPDDGYTVGGFATKGCSGIPSGPKVGTEGWVFSNPVKTLVEVVYVFGMVLNPETKPEGAIVAVTTDGVKGIPLEAAKLKGNVKALTKATESGVKELAAKTAKAADGPKITGILDGVPTVPAPAGVSGDVLPANGGAWLQTPPGTILVYGVLLHDGGVVDTEKFELVSVCAPAAAPAPTPSATKAPGTGGGTGDSLPLTGANVGIVVGLGALLLALGGGLLFVRRRRATKFVA